VTPEVEKRLEDLIAYTPSKPPDSYPYCWCALTRAQYALGVHFRRLSDFGQSIGLTFGESCGIMSGWDLASGGQESCAVKDEEPGYDEGVELGRRLYQKYGCTEESK